MLQPNPAYELRAAGWFSNADGSGPYSMAANGTMTLIGSGGAGGGGGGDASAANQTAGNTTLTAISTAAGAPADAAATSDGGSFSLIALIKRLVGKLPASLGSKADAASLSVTQSTEDKLLVTAANASLAALQASIAVTAAGTPGPATRVVGALASTGATSNVAAATANTTILAANASRLGFRVFNDSASATLYLLLSSGTPSTTVYTVQVGPGGFFEDNSYAGIVKGIWSAAVGAARVTEIS